MSDSSAAFSLHSFTVLWLTPCWFPSGHVTLHRLLPLQMRNLTFFFSIISCCLGVNKKSWRGSLSRPWPLIKRWARLLSGEFNSPVRWDLVVHSIQVHYSFCAVIISQQKNPKMKTKAAVLHTRLFGLWCALTVTMRRLDQKVGWVRASTLILPQQKQEWDDSNPESHSDKQPKAASCLPWAEERRWICVESKWFHSNETVKRVSLRKQSVLFFFSTEYIFPGAFLRNKAFSIMPMPCG